MTQILRLIGDCHGKMYEYLNIAKEADFSIQLGDLGFRYDLLTKLSSDSHKVLGGNHDNYEKINNIFVNQTSHFLGDYGLHVVPGEAPIYFVRGGHSIDKEYRKIGIDWWPDEQLSYVKMVEALDAYIASKPQIVISHECPKRIIPEVSTLSLWKGNPIPPSATSLMLDYMFDVYKPKYWFFGHHHKSWQATVEGTNFICLDELEEYDIFLSNPLGN